MSAAFIALAVATDNFGAGGFGGPYSRKSAYFGSPKRRQYKGPRPAPKIDHPMKELLSKESYVNRYEKVPVKVNPVSPVEIAVMAAFLVIIVLAIVGVVI